MSESELPDPLPEGWADRAPRAESSTAPVVGGRPVPGHRRRRHVDGDARQPGRARPRPGAALFPANVQMALDAGTERQAMDMPAGRFRAVALAWLPLPVPIGVRAARLARQEAVSPAG